MPKAKSAKKTSKKEVEKNNFLSSFKFEESYISLVIGVVVVLLVAGGLVFFLKGRSTTDTSSVQYKPTIDLPQEKGTGQLPFNLPTSYEIKEGDNLWSISEKFYKSGYNWIDIAKVNNLSEPESIHTGNKLVIPNVKPIVVDKIEQTGPVKTVLSKQITGSTYKIQKGDYLWDISVRAYGDGYQWVKIAKANNLTNPDLIFSGNVLKIPK